MTEHKYEARPYKFRWQFHTIRLLADAFGIKGEELAEAITPTRRGHGSDASQ
jgi:hypothetical protein